MDQKLKHALLQKQVQEAGVMNAFCYPYSRLLLDKVISLKKEEKLFFKENGICCFTDVGYSVMYPLAEQLSDAITFSKEVVDTKQIDKIIEVAEEFLAIFEK